jgi:hypothetical protein
MLGEDVFIITKSFVLLKKCQYAFQSISNMWSFIMSKYLMVVDITSFCFRLLCNPLFFIP